MRRLQRLSEGETVSVFVFGCCQFKRRTMAVSGHRRVVGPPPWGTVRTYGETSPSGAAGPRLPSDLVTRSTNSAYSTRKVAAGLTVACVVVEEVVVVPANREADPHASAVVVVPTGPREPLHGTHAVHHHQPALALWRVSHQQPRTLPVLSVPTSVDGLVPSPSWRRRTVSRRRQHCCSLGPSDQVRHQGISGVGNVGNVAP